MATEIVVRGRKTWSVRLRPGTYTYKCDPHEIVMKGTFRVSCPSPAPQRA